MSTLQFEINDITMMIGAASTVLISKMYNLNHQWQRVEFSSTFSSFSPYTGVSRCAICLTVSEACNSKKS